MLIKCSSHSVYRTDAGINNEQTRIIVIIIKLRLSFYFQIQA